MTTKKTAKRARVGNSAGTMRKKASGKPFEKGNPHAFKPGKSGNPSGRPKSCGLAEALRERLQEQYPGKDGATYSQMVAHKLIDLAVEGELTAIREVFDRIEGKPRQAVDVTTDEKRLNLIERTIATLMEKMERDEAIAYLSTLKPEIRQWIN